MENKLYRWVKASELGLPHIEVVTFYQLVEYGRNNGANIVNGMPWSFHYKNHSVTHENDEKYLVGWMSVSCTKDNPIVLFNDKVFNYWKNLGRLSVVYKGFPDVLICCEGVWSFWSGRDRGLHIKVRNEDLQYIEWLEPLSEINQEEAWKVIGKELFGFNYDGFEMGAMKELSSKYILLNKDGK